MKKLNVAIIGCGVISRTHIDVIKQNEAVNLYAVCDCDEQVAIAAAEREGCKYYIDFEEMLEDKQIDVLHICTPHYLHFQMVCKGLEKGKHVLTEKPLGMNQKECEIMKELADSSEYKGAVCMQNRMNPTSIALKEIVDQGAYGQVKGMRALVSWKRDKSYYEGSPWKGKWRFEGGGLLMNQMIHTLDLMQWLGGSINKIRGNASNRLLEGVIEEEDTVEATLWFENGAVGSFYATNTYSYDAPVMLEVHLEKAILRLQDRELFLIQEESKKCIAEDRVAQTGKSYWGVSHKKVIDQFYDAILNNHDNYMRISEGVKSVLMCKEIYKDSGIEP